MVVLLIYDYNQLNLVLLVIHGEINLVDKYTMIIILMVKILVDVYV